MGTIMKPNLQFTLNPKILMTMLSLMFASGAAQAKPNEIALQKQIISFDYLSMLYIGCWHLLKLSLYGFLIIL